MSARAEQDLQVGREEQSAGETRSRPGVAALAASVLAFAGLNLLFTYANRVSSFGIEPTARLSAEVLVLMLALAAWKQAGRQVSRWALAAAGTAIAIGAAIRYVDVTAPGVLGRRFDLQADLPHLGNVASMFLDTLSPLRATVVVAASLFGVLALAVASTIAVGLLSRGLDDARLRGAALVLALIGLGSYVVSAPHGTAEAADSESADWDPWVGRIEPPRHDSGLFAEPVSSILARQLSSPRDASRELRLASPVSSDLRALEDEQGRPAHVVLVFLESYGVTLLDDPQHFPLIEPTFLDVERRLSQGGWTMRSVRAVSPTFGGGSWRAHATLMSGLWIDNERLYDRLLDSDLQALPHLLADRGYRTVAAEPGIREAWPEADWFRFDHIYDASGLDYRGAEIGWWKVPDQYTLYKIWRDELRDADRPVFAKLSLILSHIPYKPIPPVVDDWSRFEDGSAYGSGLPSVAHDDYRDLRELSSRYVDAFRYELESLALWLLELVPENTLVIVSGDHQPPKLATHDNDSWDVPLHVLSRRPELVEAFAEAGFVRGLRPPPQARLPMDAFLPAFLEGLDRPDRLAEAP